MKRILLAVNAFIWIAVSASGQEAAPVTFYDFRIYKGTSDEKDVTAWLLEAEMRTVFYLHEEDSVLMMANMAIKTGSQSYGPLVQTKDSEYAETEDGDEIEAHYFDWRYTNDYDEETGIAKVKAIIITKKDAIYLNLSIVPNDFRLIIYHDIMEREPDL